MEPPPIPSSTTRVDTSRGHSPRVTPRPEARAPERARPPASDSEIHALRERLRRKEEERERERERVRAETEAQRVPPLRLVHSSKAVLFNITRRKLNQGWADQFGDESRFWAKDWQFHLEKREDGWFVVPNESAPNETMLNSKKITTPQKLSSGDVLGVGREAKGIVKSPMRVEIE